MHNHSSKGFKLQRKRDQRNALVKNLANSLILEESITTTRPKAKTVVPYVEKLITHAKKNTLHGRRIIISSLDTLEAAHKLQDVIAPATGARSSGYLRIERSTSRKGDNTQLATISFVDAIPEAQSEPKKSSDDKKTAAQPKKTAKSDKSDKKETK